MGDEQRPTDGPSLEAPSLGRMFGRRKQRKEPAQQPAQDPSGPAGAPAGETSGRPTGTPEAVVPAEAPEPVQDEPGQPEPAPTAQEAEPRAFDTVVIEDTAAPPPSPRPRLPRPTLTVSGRVVAAVTGLLIGLLVVVLTAGSLALCESVRGVSSCGGGPGFALLVAVTGSMVALGGLLLRLAKVPDPTSTSFLAVGLLCVLALLFLIDSLDQWWMIIVIPLISVGTFLLSHWVTTTVIEPGDD